MRETNNVFVRKMCVAAIMSVCGMAGGGEKRARREREPDRKIALATDEYNDLIAACLSSLRPQYTFTWSSAILMHWLSVSGTSITEKIDCVSTKRSLNQQTHLIVLY